MAPLISLAQQNFVLFVFLFDIQNSMYHRYTDNIKLRFDQINTLKIDNNLNKKTIIYLYNFIFFKLIFFIL